MANKQTKARAKGGLGPLWRGFRPAVPATVGAFTLTFLFAAMMPMPWIAAICWNLYLDTIHPIFAAPLGNGARVGVALLFALGAAVIALVAALALIKPTVKGNRAMNQRVAARARQGELNEEAGSDVDQPIRRRRVDMHPDEALVAPIRADRDLPAGGLGPIGSAYSAEPLLAHDDSDDEPLDLGGDMMVGDDAGTFELSDPAPVEPSPASKRTDPADNSLDAMVARFEAGLGRRRKGGTTVSGAAPAAANEDEGHGVDLALEAALSTLQRMSRSAIG